MQTTSLTLIRPSYWFGIILIFLGAGRLWAFPMMGQPKASGTWKADSTLRSFSITENDTLSYTLKLVLDEQGKPQYFFRNIFTPVCYTNECKPVYINFYWDLLGNYQRFDMPPGKILTKVDHDEFLEEDYQKLQDILSRENSIFQGLEMKDLITEGTDELSDSVDTKSGATLKTIKNEVIDGAVYTCFTLWKIAYGRIPTEIRNIFPDYENDDLLLAFLKSDNHHYQYWAIDRAVNSAGYVEEKFATALQGVIEGQNIFTARYALGKIGPAFLKTSNRQVWLQQLYDSAAYATQLIILKKLPSIPLEESALLNWIERMPSANREQRKYLTNMLKGKTLPPSALGKLVAYLHSEDRTLASESLEVLQKLEITDATIKTQIRTFQEKN